MKKKIATALVLCSFLAITKVQAQPVNTAFKDDRFYACVIDNFNSENGAAKDTTYNLSQQELETIEHLVCSNEGITNITGIETMTALQTIDLSNNELATLEGLQTKENNVIEVLNISNNNIKNLYISRLTNLRELDISNNEMEYFTLANYIPTLRLSGNAFMKNIQLSLKNKKEVNIKDYILFDNVGATTKNITVEYNIQDETIVEKGTIGNLTAKKAGTTRAQLIIKNGDEVIYGPTTTGNFPANSTINVTDACMPVLTGARRYTVKLETNGGKTLEDISDAYNFSENLEQKILELPIPEKEEYKFMGWYVDKELKTEAKIKTYADLLELENINEDECDPNVIVKIYAKWEEDINNPKTGIKTSLILDAGIVLISGTAFLILSKKNKYNKI